MLFNVAIKDLYVKFQEVIGEFFGRVRKSRVAPILDDKNETFDNASDFQFFGQSFQVDENTCENIVVQTDFNKSSFVL